MTTIVVVTAGMGTPSSSRLLGDRLAEATVTALTQAGGPAPDVQVLELRELAVDLAQYYSSQVPSRALRAAFEAVGRAAGVIAVSPVLNAGVNGLFKMFFDLLDVGVMNGRPVLMGATGGTARHSLAVDQSMLPLFFYLKATLAPTAVFAATEDWGSSQAALTDRIGRAASEFAALITARPATDYADEFDDVPDFSTLLGQ